MFSLSACHDATHLLLPCCYADYLSLIIVVDACPLPPRPPAADVRFDVVDYVCLLPAFAARYLLRYLPMPL